MAKRCQVCLKISAVVIYELPARQICCDCFVSEREEKRKLVSKIADYPDRRPPLGYHFIGKEWVLNQQIGKASADAFFQIAFGVSN